MLPEILSKHESSIETKIMRRFFFNRYLQKNPILNDLQFVEESFSIDLGIGRDFSLLYDHLREFWENRKRRIGFIGEYL